MPKLDIGDLTVLAKDFARKLDKVKQKHSGSVTPGWYPYPTFANIPVLNNLLTGRHRDLSELIAGRWVLDMGAGDGDLSFFLESLGVKVDAIDHPAINYNTMTALHTLKAALGSSVDIQTLDLDSQFKLARPTYGLVLLFGVLYHLKNPFYVMEALARQCEYCLMSTRIARVTPDGRVRIDSLPVAYLVAERETNNDPTNFWIFTQPALERMFDRAGWEICDFTTIGRKADSDPVNSDRDERAFYLLRSRALDYSRELQLGDGWYELEQNMWRWTEKSFSVFFAKPSHAPNMAQLSFHFYLPESLMPARRELVLNATINGVALEKQTYSSPGEHVYHQKIPPPALEGDKFDIRFDVEKPFSFSGDDRELGVLVGFTERCPVLLSFS